MSYRNHHRTARKLSDHISTLTRQTYLVIDKPEDPVTYHYALARWEGQHEYTMCSKWLPLPALIKTMSDRLDKMRGELT